MKKIMWVLAALPLIVTSAVLQFMPDSIPMHYDLAGNADRWGNKLECFIFPVVIFAIALFWHFLIKAFEKKAVNAKTEKEQMESKSVVKYLCIAGIAETIMFGVMHCFMLYSSYVQALSGENKAAIDISNVSCLLCGILCIVLGNSMTKTKKNALAGVRTTWSMYNDNTWRKSNHFGAICIMAAGFLTVITTVLVKGIVSTIFFLVYVIAAAIIMVMYSKKVYEEEIQNEKQL